VQEGAATVQGVLEGAGERLNGRWGRVLGASRTDAGVHARGQVARFRTPRDLPAARVPHALNAHLPEDVVVVSAREVAPEFHPIRDAASKRYRYTLRVAEFDDPFDRRFVLRVPRAPDVDAMARAAGLLVGRHDFAGFQKTGSPRAATVRELRQLDVVRSGEYIHLDFVGDGFLYGMARNLAGTLLRVGHGGLDPGSLPEGLASASRTIAGPCLPAHGLCLLHVGYGAGGNP
jgi:tRNA pseudouridine38-40 synthase